MVLRDDHEGSGNWRSIPLSGHEELPPRDSAPAPQQSVCAVDVLVRLHWTRLMLSGSCVLGRCPHLPIE
jgi:hypothetical protein